MFNIFRLTCWVMLFSAIIRSTVLITGDKYKNIKIEFSEEYIIPAGGLAVVGAVLDKSDFVKRCNHMDVTQNRFQHQIKNGDSLLTYTGMLCMGKSVFESVHEFDDDQEFYKYVLENTRSIPSEETLRQHMDVLAVP